MHWKPIVSSLMLLMPIGCAPRAADPALTAASESDYVEYIPGTAIAIEMVWIPEGAFWIGRTEITWEQYLPYCDFDRRDTLPPGTDAISRPSKPLDGVPYDRDWGVGTRPAVGVSWNAAKQYCNWLSGETERGYRLPTEDEWTLACGPDMDDMDDMIRYAWCDENSQAMTQEVGTRAPTAHGLHDMFGNLWEYCANPYDPADPDRAVLRGGSWRDPAATIRRAARLRFNNDWTLEDPNVPAGVWWIPDGDHLGFRLLRSGNDTDVTNGGPHDAP